MKPLVSVPLTRPPSISWSSFGTEISALAPLDYRYALDAAMPLLARAQAPLLLCRVPQLAIPLGPDSTARASDVALWVEPLADTWQADLALLATHLAVNGQLLLVFSRPLAAILPERRSWGIRALGTRLGGIRRLRSALSRAGFSLETGYGIHTVVAMGLNLISQQLERWGRPDLGDRLHFAARLRYCTDGPLAVLSTVALLVATKVS